MVAVSACGGRADCASACAGLVGVGGGAEGGGGAVDGVEVGGLLGGCHGGGFVVGIEGLIEVVREFALGRELRGGSTQGVDMR